MKGVYIYKPLERAAPVPRFIDGLDARLREKLIRQLITLPGTPRTSLREPHYKHFALERCRELYELRERPGPGHGGAGTRRRGGRGW